MKKILAASIALAALSGCASTPEMGNVLPLQGGAYQVDGLGSTNDIAMKSALYTADKTCKGQSKRHVVTGQTTQYKGVVSQDTGRAIDTAAQVVAGLTGTWLPSLAKEDDYRITLLFRCEP